MDSSTLSSSTFTLAPVDSSGNVGQPITATVTYDSATKKATLDPSADLNPGTKYTATVTTGAKDKAGNPLISAKVWSFTTAQIAAPTNLTATRAGSISKQSVNLTWTDNSTNENNFTVERSSDNGKTWNVLTSTLAANTTSYADKSVSRGTTYWYRVKATKGTLSSGYSNVASAITK
jgi:hypothetical protein